MSAPRFGLRFFSQSSRQTATRAPLRTKQQIFRRHESTAAAPSPDAPQQSLLKRLWTSEVGIKTVHFWYVSNYANLPLEDLYALCFLLTILLGRQ